MMIDNAAGHYRFLKGIRPYSSAASGGSCAVVAAPGYEIVHVTLAAPLAFESGFRLMARHLAGVRRPLQALCGVARVAAFNGRNNPQHFFWGEVAHQLGKAKLFRDFWAGGPMKEYVDVPPSVLNSDAKLDDWLGKAFAYARTLPPKEKKGKMASQKKSSGASEKR